MQRDGAREVTWRDVYPPMKRVYGATWERNTRHGWIYGVATRGEVNRSLYVFIAVPAWPELFAGVNIRIAEQIRR